jgi:hypothetical protein
LVDHADIFSAATESLATRRIIEIAGRQDAEILIYTQYKPGSSATSTELDAVALMDEWDLENGLVILWNTTRPQCAAGVVENGQVQLYADARYSAIHASNAERQAIFEDGMLPLLRECEEEAALSSALDGIEAASAPLPTATPGNPSPSPPISSEGPCGDPTYSLSGFRWTGSFNWYFLEGSQPAGHDMDAVLEVLMRSASNITSARNDCGLPDRVDVAARYVSTTSTEPCRGKTSDGLNVVGFGKLPRGTPRRTLAIACPYGDGDQVFEADILISPDVSWALSEEECRGFDELLEAVATHEFGHVFGLDHVNERLHGELTMSPRSNGPCSSAEITLGLGDVLGLEELY